MASAEEELVQTALDRALLHADETSWPELAQTLWLWVFVATTATLYDGAGRGKERVENGLDGFTGWLMSDGRGSYRHYPHRRRRWAHRIRKARGLAQSRNREAHVFGRNEAERAPRHWVIPRQLSLGTCTPVGSRVLALLASVIDTCHQRGPLGAISNAPSPTAAPDCLSPPYPPRGD